MRLTSPIHLQGLVLAEQDSEGLQGVIHCLLKADLRVTLICTGRFPVKELDSRVDVIQADWQDHFSKALNFGLTFIEPGTWIFRIDTYEHPPEDLRERLLEALALAEEKNTDALVVPVVEWEGDSYLPICQVRLWRHADSRRYRGAASEVLYHQPSGLPLHRSFYPLAPGTLTLRHTPSPTRDWQRPLRRKWIKDDPESKMRSRVLDLNEAICSEASGWQSELIDYFSSEPTTTMARMLHGGSLSLVLLADYIFSRSQETLMRKSTIRLIEHALGMFGWSPLVLLCALRLLVVSDYRGPWLDEARILRDELIIRKAIFHSLRSVEMLAAVENYLAVIEKDAYDFRYLEYVSPISLGSIMKRYINCWDRLDPGACP